MYRRAADADPGGFSTSGGVGIRATELLAEDGLVVHRKTVYRAIERGRARPIDDMSKTKRVNSSEVLASLFELEMKGMVRQIPGKQFRQGAV